MVTPDESLPVGRLALLFTDIEGSTSLLTQLGPEYGALLARHHQLLGHAIDSCGGRSVATDGDAFFAVFGKSEQAVEAAMFAQRALTMEPWPGHREVRVRMGIHTGTVDLEETGYVGLSVHRAARIGSAAHGGQILLSEATRNELEGVDRTFEAIDLGEFELKDFTDPEHLFQISVPGLPLEFPPPRTRSARRNNLPMQLSSFIGRELERRELGSLIPSQRLVSITGPGGSGKTRLALAVAHDLLEQFSDGVWVTELAGIDDGALVAPAVLRSLRVPDQPGRASTDVLIEYLSDKRTLLLLDNCEHLVEDCRELVGRLLRGCPNLTVVSTSRQRLSLPGELSWVIPPLSVPMSDGDDLLEYDSARLFVERAHLFIPDFEPNDANRDAMMQLCRDLDGMPLAIELAAARLQALDIHTLVNRLGDRFRILKDAGNPERHQTLEVALRWSHDLLDDDERAVLRRLAVFQAGCTLEAAERVCSGTRITEAMVIDILSDLVDKSMVVAERTERDGTRYSLLQTIRLFALAELDDHDEHSVATSALVGAMLNLTSGAEAGMLGAEDLMWFRRADAELENLRVALAWAVEQDIEAALRLVGDLWVYWWVRGLLAEGVRHAEMALAQSDERHDRVARARAHATASFLSYCEGDRESLRRHASAAVELGEASGNGPLFTWSTAWALLDLGEAAQQENQLDATQAYFEKALSVSSKGGHEFAVARSFQQLAYVTEAKGEPHNAVELAAAGLRRVRATGNRTGISRLLYTLARLKTGLGDIEGARAAYEESLAQSEDAGDVLGIRGAHEGLGTLAYMCGDWAAARSDFERVRSTSKAIGQPPSFRALELFNLATTASGHGDYKSAREWLAEARNLSEAGGDADLTSRIVAASADAELRA